jgi:hypothetical protein
MILRQQYARPRPRAIAATGSGRSSWHRRYLSPATRPQRAPPDRSAGLLLQVTGIGPLPVGVLWVSCRPPCVVGPLAARDGGTSQ